MAADVDLANQALVHVGDAPITALDDASLRARVVNLSFWDVADDLMAEHPWNFNKFRSEVLATDFDTPNFEYAYRYALPTDPWALRVLRPDDDDRLWKVEGRFLLSDSAPMSILYLGRVTDIGAWPPPFKTAFVYHLARRIAYPLTKSIQLARDMAELAQIETRRARSLNGLEGPPIITTSTVLTDVRR